MRAPWRGAAVALALATAVAACGTSEGAEAEGPGTVQVESARELASAYANAASGTTIELAAGTYDPPQLERRPGASTLLSPVVLRAAPDADVEVQDLDVAGPLLRIEGLHLTGIVRLRAGAVGSSLDHVRLDPGNLIIEADRASVTNSRLQAPPDRDALDVGATDGDGPVGVEVRGNVIGPGTLSPGSDAHVDCLQVMSATDLVVVGNVLFDCPAQTLLVKSDLGPIEGVRIVRNALRGCRPRTDACPAYMTLQVVPGAHPISGIHLEGNSVAGALRAVDGVPAVTIVANAIDHVEAGCGYLGAGNAVGDASCELPPGTRTGPLRWADVDAEPPDLRAAPDSPAIDAGPPAMAADADGRTTACGSRWDAGAFERC